MAKTNSPKQEEVVVVEQASANEGLNENLNSVTTLAPLTAQALQHFDETKQKEIVDLSAQIDVRQIEKVMCYGQAPLIRSFESAGRILQADQGSAADQQVIQEVLQLSKQAKDSYSDFNLALKEPNAIEKFVMKIFTSIKDKQDKEISVKALTNYKLLEQLSKSCDKWIESLVDGYEKIYQSALDDKADCEELEQYIVAGRIAEERIKAEVQAAKEAYELSGLIADKEELDKLQEGLDTFHVVLLNLEKSRAAFGISIGQLSIQEKTNKNVQIAVRTQKANSMALASQQLRNALLDAKNKIALEGQKSISGLNNELMKKVAENTVLTAEESEKILVNGVYSIEAALTAAKTVIDGCEAIRIAREQRNENVAKELDNLKGLLGEIEPFVTKLIENSSGGSSSSTSKTSRPTTSGSMKF